MAFLCLSPEKSRHRGDKQLRRRWSKKERIKKFFLCVQKKKGKTQKFLISPSSAQSERPFQMKVFVIVALSRSFKKNFGDSSWAIKKMPLKTVSLLQVKENVAVVF